MNSIEEQTPYQPSEELWQLTGALCDNTLTEAQRDRLEELLPHDTAARQFCAAYLDLHAQFLWRYRESAIEQPVVTPSAAMPSASRSPILGFLSRISHNSPRGTFTVGAMVVLVVVVAFWGLATQLFQKRESQISAGDTVASIRSSSEVKWSAGTPRKADEELVRVGELLRIDSGVVELQLKQGARLAVAGPATWSIDGDNNATLAQGKLVATVPAVAIGFTLETPTARIVDKGTEFGVEVTQANSTEVHVLQGRVETTRLAAVGDSSSTVELEAGSAIRIPPGATSPEKIPADRKRFAFSRPASVEGVASQQAPFAGTIWLGNLFDDPRGTALAKAIQTDTFRATPEIDDLGVHCALYGDVPIQKIAPERRWDFSNLGWTVSPGRQAANDAFCAEAENWEIEGGPRVPGGGIQTLGKPITRTAPRIEEGIGLQASSVLTFDLEEIRQAGSLAGQALRFVSDRAGINDCMKGHPISTVHLLVIVDCGKQGVQVYLDGVSATASEQNGVWSITSPIGPPIRGDGKFVAFEVPVPAEARYLSLVSGAAGDGNGGDLIVWNGARLEWMPSAVKQNK